MMLLTYFPHRRIFLRVQCIFLWLFIAFCLQILPTSFSYASGINANFSVQPAVPVGTNQQPQPYFIFNSHPATFIYNRIHVVNTGMARGSATIYAVDATTSANGGVTYLSSATRHYDVGSWVALSQKRLTLKAGQSQDVLFRLVVPRNASSGQHVGGIVVENVAIQNAVSNTSTGSTRVKLHVKELSVVPIVVNIPGRIEEQLFTSGIHFDSTNPFQRVLIFLSNTGNVIIRPRGSAMITNNWGRIMQRAQLNMNTFLPHTSIQYPLNIMKRALPAGIYRVRFVLNYGRDMRNRLDATIPFQVRKTGKPLTTFAPQVAVPGLDDFLHSLALWQYVLAGIALLLVGSASFFGIQKACMMLVKVYHKS